MWPFKKTTGDIESRVVVLEAQLAAMRAEYLANLDKVMDAIQKMQARYGSRDYQDQKAAEKNELQNILGTVDIPSLLKDPDALKTALANPALINFALKKFAKEMI